jgi:transducin (beta)-like 1
MKGEKCLQSLSEHTEGIYTLRWSPIPEGSNQLQSVNLATASFDSTIKIWDVEHGRCLRTLAKHSEAVCSIAYSPDGCYLVSGSFDKHLRIWSTKVRMAIDCKRAV